MAKGAYIGVPKPEYEPVFENNSWSQIIKACQKKEVPSTWVVGDQKAMTINGKDYLIDIIGKDHDDYADGSGKAPLTFQMHDIYNVPSYAMNASNTNSGGWTNSVMRNTHLPAILALMPSEVQNGIKEVNKLTSAGSTSSTINTTADKLFLLSEIEIFGSRSYSYAGEGSQYAYYVNGGSTLKKKNNVSDTWWERSPRDVDYTSFCRVDSGGAANRESAGNALHGAVPAFCFGGTSEVNNTFGGFGVARKIKKGYVGIATEFPIYEETVTTAQITASNIGDMFTVTNGTYYFAGAGSTFTTTNGGVSSSTATTKLTAKSDMSISFDYSYSSEANYDKFTLKVAGATVENAVSGATMSKSYSGSLTEGQSIEFAYAKDGSQNSNDDKCTFSNMSVTVTVTTQVGTEIKEVARKIKKAYIGIGGVARPCWSGGELAYYGAITGLDTGRGAMGTATIGKYALFAGGRTAAYTEKVDSYDDSLVKTTPTQLDTARAWMGSASVGNYALFAGGTSTSVRNKVDAYDSALTHTIPSALDYSVGYLAGTSCGNYAFFAGGENSNDEYVNHAYSYDASLTKKKLTGMGYYRDRLKATSVGEYAVFAGGMYSYDYECSAVDAYNQSLTKTSPTFLSKGRLNHAATSVGNYALFAGGADHYNSGTSFDTVDAYDTSLTRTTPTVLSVARMNLGATTIGNYAIFAGGETLSSTTTTAVSTVDVYDPSLTRTTFTDLSTARADVGGAAVGAYAIFAGGGKSITVVDAYTIA